MMEILRRLEEEGMEENTGQELGEEDSGGSLEERLAGLDLGRAVWQLSVYACDLVLTEVLNQRLSRLYVGMVH